MTTVWSRTNPDLDAHGNLLPDMLTDQSPAARDFNRAYVADPKLATLEIARQQRRLPDAVERFVQGRTYAGATPFEGARGWQREVDWALQEYGRQRGFDRVVTNEQFRRMGPAETDEVIDRRGQVRPGILFVDADAVPISDGTDQATRTELSHRGVRI